jgi:hypothetical protein
MRIEATYLCRNAEAPSDRLFVCKPVQVPHARPRRFSAQDHRAAPQDETTGKPSAGRYQIGHGRRLSVETRQEGG